MSRSNLLFKREYLGELLKKVCAPFSFFVSDDWIQICFDSKRVTNKMSSSLLNVSNDSSKSEEFSLNDIEVLVDNKEENWFKRADVGKFLGIEDIWTSLNGLEKCKMITRQELIPTRRSTLGWSGSKDQQNKTDKFLSVLEVM